MKTLGEILLVHEGAVRMGCFVTLLLVLFAAESMVPRRRPTRSRLVRWYSNLGLSVINSVVLRIGFPILALGTAEVARQRGWGLFNQVDLPYALALVASAIALDFVIYLQHRWFHSIPLLWRLHRVHHSDVDLDVSSAVRFHFLEIALSMLIKLGAVCLLGPPTVAVVAFEVWLNATSLFHHSNLRIPKAVDRVLRWFVVTPDMHRVHHSVVAEESNSNYSFNLPWWDHLLGTYRAQPAAGHHHMVMGTEAFRSPGEQHLHRLLIQPLRAEEERADNRDATRWLGGDEPRLGESVHGE